MNAILSADSSSSAKRRRWRRALKSTAFAACVALVLGCTTLLAGLGADHADTKLRTEFGIRGDRIVLGLLREARRHVGTPNRIASVRGLRIEGARLEPHQARAALGYAIAFPDRFRWTSEYDAKGIDGQAVWESSPVGAAGGLNPLESRTTVVRHFVEVCLMMLLRSPLAQAVVARDEGHRAWGTLSGRTLAISDQHGSLILHVVLDPKTSELVGLATPLPTPTSPTGATPGQENPLVLVSYIEEHVTVSGLRMPSKLTRTVGRSSVMFAFDRIVIDPPFAQTEFQKPAHQLP